MVTNFTDWDAGLTHHGITGQKWGKRRFQNEDGSLTPEGAKRYGYQDPRKPQPVKAMTDTGTGGSKSSSSSSNGGESHEDYVKRKVAEAQAADKRWKESRTGKGTEKKKGKGGGKGSSGKGASNTAKQKRTGKAFKANLSKYDVSSSVMNKVHALLQKGRS